MQNQYFPPPQVFQQQLFNPNLVRPEGCYQISPFGVVLQPVTSQTNSEMNTLPQMPHLNSQAPHLTQIPSVSFPANNQISSPPPLSPIQMSPVSPSNINHPMPPASNGAKVETPVSLSPLSCGGFIYSIISPPQAPPQPPVFTPTQKTPVPSTNICEEIKCRQDKLDKYREKRTKRNFNRPVDPGRRERACARSRDQHGHFVSEKNDPEKMREALEASQRESEMLKSRLNSVEQELATLRQKAEEANAFKFMIAQQLEAQQKMNQDLIRENSALWSSVPVNQVFNTVNQTNPPEFIEAFKQKIDFSTVELNWTDSRFLEQARMEDEIELERWEEIFANMPGMRS